MRHDRLAFPEAVRALAERTGVVLAASREAEPEVAGKLEALRRVMALAAEFYSRSLWEAGGAKAREYLDTRGVDAEVARRFGLGYAPASWDALLSRMKAEGVGDDLLVQAGLVLPRQTGGGFYDRFRGRLLFPIRDTQGRVVAFGGRALAGEEPKYLNSPETPLYVKGQILYALDVARAAMRERGRAILVEGYLDCVMAHQHGFTETVAALGTAFTPAQLGLLRRHADEVIALFDADAAGQKAASRIEEMMTDGPDIQDLGWSVSRTGGFEKAGVFSVRVAVLPTGHDPDSLLRAEGAEALRARLDAARSLLSFVLDKALAEDDLGTPRGRATAHARVALLLSKVSNAEEATMLSREAGRRLGVDATQLWIEAQQRQGARARGRRVDPEPAATAAKSAAAAWAAPSFAERDLLALLLHFDDARAELLTVLEDEDVAHPGLRRLLTVLRRAPLAPPEALMADLETEAERGLLSALLVEERQWSDTQVIVDETKKRYDMRRRKQQLRQGLQAIVHRSGVGRSIRPEVAKPACSVSRSRRWRSVTGDGAHAPAATGPHAPR